MAIFNIFHMVTNLYKNLFSVHLQSNILKRKFNHNCGSIINLLKHTLSYVNMKIGTCNIQSAENILMCLVICKQLKIWLQMASHNH